MKLNPAQARVKAIEVVEEQLRLEAQKRAQQHALDMQRLRIDLLQQVQAGNAVAAVDSMLGVFESLRQENEQLVLKNKAATIAIYGRQTQRLKNEFLGQLVLALGGTQLNANQDEPTVAAQTKRAQPLIRVAKQNSEVLQAAVTKRVLIRMDNPKENAVREKAYLLVRMSRAKRNFNWCKKATACAALAKKKCVT